MQTEIESCKSNVLTYKQIDEDILHILYSILSILIVIHLHLQFQSNITQNRAVFRAEESVKLDILLPEASDNIRDLCKSIESKLSKILEINQRINEVLVGKYSLNDSTAQTTTSNDIAEVNN
jgi:hypothetical protein